MSDSPAPGATLKHELRTPLNHIIGYCEILIEDVEDRNDQRLIADLERIHTAGRHLLAVINDVFDPVAGLPYRSNPSLFDHEVRTPLNQIIGYAEILQEDARETGATELSSDLERIHSAGRRLLETVLGHLHIIGLPTEEKPQTSKQYETSRITRVNAEATGAGNILVVDDDAANRELLARRLGRLGHRTSLAENGRQALVMLKEHGYELVLLDIQMPEVNGYEVLETMKSDPLLRHIPVIVLSASDETSRVARCVEMGAEDYLPKPFESVLLQARIGASLEKKRLRDREISYLQQIEEEKRRSDELLRVILPEDIAEELKRTQRVQPRRFDNVAVLFCDIVGFTSYCDKHPAEEVLQNLQRLVQALENISETHALEKIKTIGDSFMATAGLLGRMPDPILPCVRAGLEMIAAARELPPHWQLRVGVHSGSVMAGVVGRRKYQYDIWGDTVNIAARMEHAADPGTVCVSEELWGNLAGQFTGQSRGRVPVKGKGEVAVVHIHARSTA